MNLPFLAKYQKHWRDPFVGGEAWTTDLVHMASLWAVIEEHRPKRIVEIGSYMGGSACLWVEALEQGIAQEVHLFEPFVRPELVDLVNGSSKAQHITIHNYSYYDFPIPCDFLWIDGDHGWHALADFMAALTMDVPVIAAHDSHAHQANDLYSDCWGSWLACNILRQSKRHYHYEDHASRPGCRTERGLFISIKQ